MRNSFGSYSLRGSLAVVVLTTSILVATDSCGGGDNGNHSSPPIAVTISTRPAALNAGSTYNFVASVANSSNSSVTWKLACPTGVTDCGSIGSSDGTYKAPIVDSSTSPTVTATSSADASKSDSWTFQLLPLPTTIKLNNPPSWINAGMSYKFSATVYGRTNTSVIWGISCSLVLSDCGSIAADGTYTSPASVAQQAPFTVTATSVADSTKSDSAMLDLLPAIAIAVTPASIQMVSGFSYPLAATVQNDLGNVGVTWSVNGIAGGNATVGTIAAVPDPVSPSRLTGVYKAPVTAPAAPVAITATSLVDVNKSASSSVSFIPNPHPSFTGDFAFLMYGPQGLGSEAAGGLITLDGAGNMTGKLDVHVSSYDDQVVPGLDVTGTYGFDGKDAGWAALTYTRSINAQSF